MSYKKGNDQIHPYSFKLKQTLRKNYFGGKSKSLPILFKVICCVLYHGAALCPNANRWLNYGIYTWWNMVPETASQLNRADRGWHHVELLTHSQAPPGTNPALVEHQLSASPACWHPTLGSQHLLQACCPRTLAKHPAQHCTLFEQLFSKLQWTWGLAKVLLYKIAA